MIMIKMNENKEYHENGQYMKTIESKKENKSYYYNQKKIEMNEIKYIFIMLQKKICKKIVNFTL